MKNCNYEKIFKDFENLPSTSHGNCFICGKECKYCKSHSVPNTHLKKIDDKEIISLSSIVINERDTILKTSITPKAAGIFKNICPECDKTLFKTYEEKIENEELSNKMMQEIALKSNLYRLYLNKFRIYRAEKEFNEKPSRKNINTIERLENDKKNIEQKIKNRSYTSTYNIIADEELNLNYNITCNMAIVPYLDFNGILINDLDNISSTQEDTMYIYIFKTSNDKLRTIIFTENFEFNFFETESKPKLNLYIKWILLHNPALFFDNNFLSNVDEDAVIGLYDSFNIGSDIISTPYKPDRNIRRINTRKVKKILEKTKKMNILK